MSVTRIALTGAIGVAGAIAFQAAGLPLPFLLGPMLACLLCALAGVRLASWPPLTNTMRTILGVAVGASFTPAIVGQMGGMMLSLALVPFFLIVCGALGYPFFRRMAGFDPATAFYSSMPGGIQDMMLFGEEAGGDPRALSLLHATRILLIVTILPVILWLVWDIDLTQPPGAPISGVPLVELGAMVGAGLLGWFLAARVGLFGASLLGPMILAAALALSGVITQRPPAEAIQLAQFFIGIVVGVKYTGVTMAEIRRILSAGLGHAVILGAIAFVFAEIAVLLALAPPLEAILAFAPGGQAEMSVLAIVAGADVAYVIAHHVLRIVFVITCAPIVFRFLR
ncbi:AbrB family transcriptional regulator [Jannaschia marina]|uniref:AbrB family transcriptional regulator n=1 Tax=Jannaschia marina TaxID=2741674 RepID=UPI002E290E77|nr:AbrB family transcriptional regulator [Jannaschia marina]